MEKSIIEIYTDGACNPNPGRGGWGVLLRYGTREKELYGGELSSTSNRMELQAAIEGLRALRWKNADVCVYTDSQYVKNGITQWVHGWKRKGWVRKKNQHVKNQDLWQELDALAMQHKIVWRWVKGHAGHPDNERADALARRGLKALRFYTR